MGNSIKQWLASARVTDNPVGDLIVDMRTEKDLPNRFRNIGEMRGFLRRKGACREALATVPAAWRRYSRWQARAQAKGIERNRKGKQK